MLSIVDLAVAGFDDRDGHAAGGDVLRREIGLGQEIAALVIEGGDPGGERAQFGEIERAARHEAAGRDQIGFGK